MSLEASKESRKQKALENLKKGRELRAKKLAEKNQPVVDEMSELDETPKQPKPIKKPRVKKEVEPIIEPPKIDPPKSEPLPPPPIETPVVKPKKQYKPREPREPKQPKIVEVERVVERVVYAPPPLDIQFY